MGHYCTKCGKVLKEGEFYHSKNIEKYPPDGILNQCKKCITMHVDNWDPETYKWILQEIDVPYIAEEWNVLLARYKSDPAKMNGTSIFGKYLAKMKLKQFKDYRYADSEAIEAERREKKRQSLLAAGMTEEEIEEELNRDLTPERITFTPRQILDAQKSKGKKVAAEAASALEASAEEEEDIFDEQLTDEDKMMLRMKWGKEYTAEEWVRMERLYNDMMNSYDIQGAGHKDTLIMLCKTSVKANELLDAGDIDGFQKMQKAYDSLMKSGKFKLWTMKNFSQYHEGLRKAG